MGDIPHAPAAYKRIRMIGLLARHYRAAMILACICIFSLSALLRFSFVQQPENPQWAFDRDSAAYNLIAQNILAGGGVSDGGTRAYRPPFYSLFLAAIYSQTGFYPRAVRQIQAALDSASAVLLFLIALLLFRRIPTALFAGFAYALFRSLIVYTRAIMTETLFVFLLLLFLWMLLLALRKRLKTLAAAAGVALGLAALTRPTVILFLPFLVVAWAVYDFRRLRRALKILSVAFVFMAFAIAPWTIRNALVLGAFVPVSTNFGANLLIGNNPEATGRYTPTPKRFALAEPTEIERDQYCREQAILFIRDNPIRFLRLCGKRLRIAYFLAEKESCEDDILAGKNIGEIPLPGNPRIPVLSISAIWHLSVAGQILCLIFLAARCRLALFARLHHVPLFVITILLAYLLAFHALIIGEFRFAVPSIPIWILFATFTIHVVLLVARRAVRIFEYKKKRMRHARKT